MTHRVTDRALNWCEQWGDIGGQIGSNDEGHLVFEVQPGDAELPHVHALLATVRYTPGLADEIARVFILMLQAERPEGTTLQ